MASDWVHRNCQWYETGTVSRASFNGFQLTEFGTRWFNISRYHPMLRVPKVGTRVTISLDETGRYVNGIEREENGA